MSIQTFSSLTELSRLSIRFVLMLGLLVWSTAPAFAGVREDIAKAKALLEKGRLQQSGKMLQAIVRRYPDNKAAVYLLGRVYYRSGQVKQAARMFKRSGTDFIDGSTAFEYGAVMFAVNDCIRAIKAFNKVNVESQRDLASFYAGVCHYKTRNYFLAERALRRAEKLPGNFKSLQRRLLLDIQKRNRDSRFGRNSQTVPYVPLPQVQQPTYYQNPYYQPQQPGYPYQPGLPGGPGAPKPEDYAGEEQGEAKKEKPAAPPKPEVGLSFSAAPKVEYSFETEVSNRYGKGEERVVTQGPIAGGSISAVYGFKPDRKGQQIKATLPLEVEVKNLSTNTNDVSYTQEEDSETLTTVTEETESDKSIFYSLKPTLTIPFSDSIEVEGGGHYAETLPDFKPDTKETEVGGFGSISVGVGSVTVKGNGSSINKESPDDDGVIQKTTDTTLGGTADVSLPKDFSATLNAEYVSTSDPTYESLDGFAATLTFGASLSKSWESFKITLNGSQTTSDQPSNEPDKQVTGISDQMKFGGEITKNFKLGIDIKVFGDYMLINRYTKTGLCAVDAGGGVPDDCEGSEKNAEATGSRMTYGLDVKFAPVEWAYASASYTIKDTEYSVKQAELRPAFEEKVTNYYTDLKFLVGVSMSF